MNALTSDGLKEWINENAKEISNEFNDRIASKLFSSSRKRERIKFFRYGENMKYDERESDSVEKFIDDVIKFMEKRIIIADLQVHVVCRNALLKKKKSKK